MDIGKQNEVGQTRRAFLAGAGASLLGAATFGIAGCSPSGKSENTEPTNTTSDASWDEEYDVVVVGAGIAGLAAAITVATEGEGATCLLAEKGAMPLGNSPVCAGYGIYTEDGEGFTQYMKELNGEHGTTPDDVLETFAEGTTWVLDWVIGLGANKDEIGLFNLDNRTANETNQVTTTELQYTSEYPELEHSYTTRWFAVGQAPGKEIKGPKHVHQLLLEKIEEFSDTLTYRPKAPFSELIQEPVTKEILGAVIDGKRIKANKGVIMTIGGFENDPEMLENYLGQGGAITGGGTGNTGDGHRACMKVGADFWHMKSVAGFWLYGRDNANTHFTNHPIYKPIPKGFGITVGVNGRRFYMDWDGFGSWGAVPYMSDLSRNVGCRHGHSQFGGEWTQLPLPSKAWLVFDQNGLEQGAIAKTASSDPVKDELCYTANTLEELAAIIDIPADELTKTVSQWNECCEKGEDIYYQRPADTLVPVSTPPYYAQLCVPSFLNTDGGPVRSARGEILDPDGNPIPHLYSAGEFGSIWGHLYQGSGNVSECLIFGRISAQNALGLAK